MIVIYAYCQSCHSFFSCQMLLVEIHLFRQNGRSFCWTTRKCLLKPYYFAREQAQKQTKELDIMRNRHRIAEFAACCQLRRTLR